MLGDVDQLVAGLQLLCGQPAALWDAGGVTTCAGLCRAGRSKQVQSLTSLPSMKAVLPENGMLLTGTAVSSISTPMISQPASSQVTLWLLWAAGWSTQMLSPL